MWQQMPWYWDSTEDIVSIWKSNKSTITDCHCMTGLYFFLLENTYSTCTVRMKRQTWPTTVNELRPLYRVWLRRRGIHDSADLKSRHQHQAHATLDIGARQDKERQGEEACERSRTHSAPGLTRTRMHMHTNQSSKPWGNCKPRIADWRPSVHVWLYFRHATQWEPICTHTLYRGRQENHSHFER